MGSTGRDRRVEVGGAPTVGRRYRARVMAGGAPTVGRRARRVVRGRLGAEPKGARNMGQKAHFGDGKGKNPGEALAKGETSP